MADDPLFSHENGLDVFDNFWVGSGLPKDWKRPKIPAFELDPPRPPRDDRDGDAYDGDFSLSVTPPSTPFRTTMRSNRITTLALPPGERLSWWRRILLAFGWMTHRTAGVAGSERDEDPKPEPPVAPSLTVAEFFRHVKNSTEELRVVGTRSETYGRALRAARDGGQTALYERLHEDAYAARSEAQLVALGLTRYVTEATLIEFIQKCPKGLRLDWLHQFTRLVPEKVLADKLRADARDTFDAYAVLHYDPEKKSWSETHAEREARKDPILFGLLRGRRNLYVVGDWVDEHDDLTLEQMAAVLGHEPTKELT